MILGRRMTVVVMMMMMMMTMMTKMRVTDYFASSECLLIAWAREVVLWALFSLPSAFGK